MILLYVSTMRNFFRRQSKHPRSQSEFFFRTWRNFRRPQPPPRMFTPAIEVLFIGLSYALLVVNLKIYKDLIFFALITLITPCDGTRVRFSFFFRWAKDALTVYGKKFRIDDEMAQFWKEIRSLFLQQNERRLKFRISWLLILVSSHHF